MRRLSLGLAALSLSAAVSGCGIFSTSPDEVRREIKTAPGITVRTTKATESAFIGSVTEGQRSTEFAVRKRSEATTPFRFANGRATSSESCAGLMIEDDGRDFDLAQVVADAVDRAAPAAKCSAP